jgi:signal peptidase I
MPSSVGRPHTVAPGDPESSRLMEGIASEEITAAAPEAHTRALAEVVLVAIVFALFVRTFLVQAFVVPTNSMEKAVLVGDHLLVNKFLYAPHSRFLASLLPYREVRRGDVIVFKFPEDPSRDFIKRAVALPGDTLEIRDRVVFVNGVPEKTLGQTAGVRPSGGDAGETPGRSRRDSVEPMRIPPGNYFALGDNRESSYDSRFWGPVPAENLKGRALLVYWSFGESAHESANPIRRLIDSVRSTHWSRTGLLVR